MSGLRAYAAAFAGALALAAPAAAHVAPAAGKVAPDRPWATVNICDTTAHPDAIGVRGSIPGLGTRRRTHMYLRIRVQFQQADGTWKDLGAAGDSGWLDAGKSRTRVRQVGRTFTIVPPQTGQAYVLRARVAFEWRRGTVVYRRAQVLTTAGHRDAAGGDPPGFSAAVCRIT